MRIENKEGNKILIDGEEHECSVYSNFHYISIDTKSYEDNETIFVGFEEVKMNKNSTFVELKKK